MTYSPEERLKRDAAAEEVIDCLDASPANKSWSRSDVDYVSLIDMQMELSALRAAVDEAKATLKKVQAVLPLESLLIEVEEWRRMR